MPHTDRCSLWSAGKAAGSLSGRFLCGAQTNVALSDLVGRSSLGGRASELRGRSVLVATTDQLAAGLALLELDGVARRLVLWPPDLPAEHAPRLIDRVSVDAIVGDLTFGANHPAIDLSIPCGSNLLPASCDRSPSYATEWVLLTSGTTGEPKMVVHSLASLSGAIEQSGTPASRPVWSTFYDIRRYGGLQIFLRAILGGGSLVFSDPRESTSEFLNRAATCEVTHISGTPSHWRRALMSPSSRRLAPCYVRLSGEIADQAILNHLRSFYPQATVSHAFASTEAGVAFDVSDGLEGFPASLIGQPNGSVEMKVQAGSLSIRSPRTAARYIRQPENLRDADGFVDTGDMLELRGNRYYFVGRRDGIINVGGQKVHPEEVEGVINRHPRVRMSVVHARKNPLVGSLVAATVVLNRGQDSASEPACELEHEILKMCREALPKHKVPATIQFVGTLALSSNGKLARRHA